MLTGGDKSSVGEEEGGGREREGGREGGATTKSGKTLRKRKRLRNEPQNVVGEEREGEQGRGKEWKETNCK